MLFPDYYFVAERRLVNHTIATKYVKNFDDCELLCYLNDSCVSANFKKDPENGGIAYACELNNATHLEHEVDLIIELLNLIHKVKFLVSMKMKMILELMVFHFSQKLN